MGLIDDVSKKIQTRGGAFITICIACGFLWTGLTFTVAWTVKWINRDDRKQFEEVGRKLDTLTTAVIALDQKALVSARNDSSFAEAMKHPLWSPGRQAPLEGITNNDPHPRRPR